MGGRGGWGVCRRFFYYFFVYPTLLLPLSPLPWPPPVGGMGVMCHMPGGYRDMYSRRIKPLFSMAFRWLGRSEVYRILVGWLSEFSRSLVGMGLNLPIPPIWNVHSLNIVIGGLRIGSRNPG